MGNNQQDAMARVLAAELQSTRKVLDVALRELTHLRTTSEHTQEVLAAMRRELAELRHPKTEATAGSVTRLVQRIALQPPAVKMAKEVPAARLFDRGRELKNGQFQHVVIAKDGHGNLVQLPCSYDLAAKFMRMPEPNRRKHWRGNRKAYGDMLTLCEKFGFVKRVGHRWHWSDQHGVFERMSWLIQFRPPHRVR